MKKTPVRRIFGSPWLWAFLIGIAVLTAMRPLMRWTPEPPPVLGQVPSFTLVSQDGRSFGSEDLRGEAYVASFFFTRCASICPLLMKSVSRLQTVCEENRVRGVRLVSVTVDPEHDTPAVLRDYADGLGVDPARWTLLTGDKEAIRRLAAKGFKVPVGEPATLGPGPLMDIAHTGKLVLVDPTGAIRGYYDTDALGLEEVYERARQVAREARR